MHLHSGDVGAASIPGDGESCGGKEIRQRESAALLSGLSTGSLAKGIDWGPKLLFLQYLGFCWQRGSDSVGGARRGAGRRFESQSCAETHQELGLAS